MNSLPFKKRQNPLSKNKVSTTTKPVREKYTATMDSDLRKRVKIASIEKGVVFSQFIEEAVMEKLEKEGF